MLIKFFFLLLTLQSGKNLDIINFRTDVSVRSGNKATVHRAVVRNHHVDFVLL